MTVDHDEDYAGPATITIDRKDVPVEVRLIAVHQPVDGKLHWSGRIEADKALHALLNGTNADVRVATPGGEADGKVGDPDPWGRYRVSGTGQPPFELEPVPLDDDL